MNDEELQHRLRRLDPSAGVSVHPAGGPRAALLMEQIMNTATATPTATATATATRATTPPSSPRRWPRFALIGTAAAALIGGAAVGLGAFGGGSSATTSVHYQLGEQADPLTTMCLAVTDYQPPAGMAAFEGTVTAVGQGSVTFEVSRWFVGGEADQVVLDVTDVASPALDGIAFVPGTEYLVAVADGQVQTCGVSAVAEPVLQQLYEQWFAG